MFVKSTHFKQVCQLLLSLIVAYNRGLRILLPRICLGCKLVAVIYQEYECSLFSKRINKDSAFRKQHSPFAHLL